MTVHHHPDINIIPHIPPIVPQDITKVQGKLKAARDKIQTATLSSGITTDLRLSLEAMVKPAARHGATHFNPVLESNFRLAEYTRTKNYDPGIVAEELTLLDSLITQIRDRLRELTNDQEES